MYDGPLDSGDLLVTCTMAQWTRGAFWLHVRWPTGLRGPSGYMYDGPLDSGGPSGYMYDGPLDSGMYDGPLDSGGPSGYMYDGPLDVEGGLFLTRLYDGPVDSGGLLVTCTMAQWT